MRFLTCRVLLAAVSTFLVGSSLLPGQEVKFSVEARLVQIEVRVTRDGKPVTGLNPSDFQLLENGEAQTVASLQWVGGRAEAAPAIGLAAPRADEATIRQRQVSGLPAVREEVPELTWVYVAPETDNPVEFRRAAEGIRSYLKGSSLEGRRISLGGLPFTDDRVLLLNTLDRMLEAPYGNGLVAAGVDPENLHLSDLEFMREVAKSVNEELSQIQLPVGFEREAQFMGPLSMVPTISVETIDRQIMFFGDLALYRYIDLIHRLSVFPGRKVIVLFRSGLRLDQSSMRVMKELSELATRNRVTFYTIDSRGLDAPMPVKDFRYALAWDRARHSNYLPNVLAQEDRFLESQAGMVILARNTGGRSILDTNGFGSVFELISEDSSNYYVLGFYPTDLEEKGRFRKIDVQVDLPGVEVEATRGYYERKPIEKYSARERQVSLRLALENLQSGALDVPSTVTMFAGEDRQPLLFFSLGTPLSGVEGKKRKNEFEVEAEVLVRVSDRYSKKLPLYHEQTFKHRIPENRYEGSAKDDSIFLSYGSQLPVTAGLYRFKGVLRDRRSGQVGIAAQDVTVPDFTQPSTPSSLLLTRSVVTEDQPPADGEGNAGRRANPLRVGNSLYSPQPAHLVHRGEMIHLLYYLYNPTDEDFSAAEQGMQLGLLKDGQPVPTFEAGGQPQVDRPGRLIRYTAFISSRSLEPGDYTVLAILPNYQTRRIPHLEAAFKVID